MANVVVIGAQWGDEGKGKIVDWLSRRADVVVRFQGGHNAGHTLVIGGTTYKLSLLPSGVVRPGKLSIIGNGVVLDPWALLQEIEVLRGQGVHVGPDNVRIAENVPLILPLHRNLDRAREAALGNARIGTTGRGIGPAYEDKVARRAIRLGDLADDGGGRRQARRAAGSPQRAAARPGHAGDRSRSVLDELRAIAPKVLPYADTGVEDAGRGAARRQAHPVRGRAGHDARHRPRHLSVRHLLEHACRAGGGGSGLGPGALNYVLGITKAYTTRVGSGPFPTELTCETGACSANAAASSAPSPAARGAAAGSTRCWSARR